MCCACCQVTSDAGRTAQVSIAGAQSQSRWLQGSERQQSGRRAALQPRVECEGCNRNDRAVTHQHHSLCCGKKCAVSWYHGLLPCLLACDLPHCLCWCIAAFLGALLPSVDQWNAMHQLAGMCIASPCACLLMPKTNMLKKLVLV